MTFLLKVISILIFCGLYAIGGQGHRWTKKWVGPSVFGVLMIVLAFFGDKFNALTFLGSVLYLLAANSFSYGESWTQNKLWKKILFRGLCGMMYGVSGVLIAAGAGHIFFGIFQAILAISGSIYFGVFNPFSKLGDRGVILEDVFISLGFVFFIPFLL